MEELGDHIISSEYTLNHDIGPEEAAHRSGCLKAEQHKGDRNLDTCHGPCPNGLCNHGVLVCGFGVGEGCKARVFAEDERNGKK